MSAHRTVPAEWEPQTACFVAWPDHPDWGAELDAVRAEFVAFVDLLADAVPVKALVAREQRAAAIAACGERNRERIDRIDRIEWIDAHYGDIWLRDTAPVFVRESGGDLRAIRFGWNGWGGKYLYDGDSEIGDHVAASAGTPIERVPWVLEGGAVEHNGAGTILTTRQCMLEGQRNRGWTQALAERDLCQALGAERVVWLDQGLKNDHTDGHIDTLARFVSNNTVLCMRPAAGDPNAEQLRDVERELINAGFSVAPVPSPGEVLDSSGTLMPASYANFVIANQAVIVPTYGVDADQHAVAAIAELFPSHRVTGSSARAILTGGGAFHCMTKEQPA